MAMMTRPMHRGSIPLGAPIFFLSVMARIHRMSAPVPITWRSKEEDTVWIQIILHNICPLLLLCSRLICCSDLCPASNLITGRPLASFYRRLV